MRITKYEKNKTKNIHVQHMYNEASETTTLGHPGRLKNVGGRDVPELLSQNVPLYMCVNFVQI